MIDAGFPILTLMVVLPTVAAALCLFVGDNAARWTAVVATLANFVLTSREARRAFGFIGSGAILGWIVGGLSTFGKLTR